MPSVATDPAKPFNTETYDVRHENPFLAARQNPLSTFSIDVDTAVVLDRPPVLAAERRLPPPAAVRIEELVNYFSYDYPQPERDASLSGQCRVAGCPWKPSTGWSASASRGAKWPANIGRPANLVFLLDVSGSMSDPNKLPLVKESMRMLAEQTRRKRPRGDRGLCRQLGPGVALHQRHRQSGHRLTRIDALSKPAARPTAARASSWRTGWPRRISSTAASTASSWPPTAISTSASPTEASWCSLIESKAASGVVPDHARLRHGQSTKTRRSKNWPTRGTATTPTSTRQPKPRKCSSSKSAARWSRSPRTSRSRSSSTRPRSAGYRLIGYENRMLRHEDFNNDEKDAGEIGAGHTVTAFYEVIPTGQPIPGSDVDPTKYQGAPTLTDAAAGRELFTVRLRYKDPNGQTSKPFEVPVVDESKPFNAASKDYQFAASVAQFGLLLADSPHRGNSDFGQVLEIASASLGPDKGGHRAEFLALVKTARRLKQPDSDRGDSELQSDARVLPPRNLACVRRRAFCRPRRESPRRHPSRCRAWMPCSII